jgi:hypothetical protein
MKRILFLFLILATSVGVQADNWISISENANSESNIQMVSSSNSETTLNFNLSGFWYNEVETNLGTAWNIKVDGSGKRLEQGRPELPLFATSLIIPGEANMNIEVVSSNFIEYQDVLIAPSKGNFDRTIDPTTVAYEFGPQYNRNEFFPNSTTNLRQPYIVRDYRGQTVLINPFVYNPVTKVLRVYYDITLNVFEVGTSKINVLSSNADSEIIDSRFNNIYQHHFLNYQAPANRYDALNEHGNMLIISYGDFMDEMAPYIEWRTKTGTAIEMVDVAEIGGASQIKTYIADYYNTNGLTFVMLIGDSQQVPSSSTGGNDSDVNYSYIVGNDHYPDVFVGRFSAETTDHVATMVERTIAYERNPVDGDWYTNAIGIGSSQGPGDDNEMDYEHIRNIHSNKLFPFTYTYGFEFFDGSQGGEDAPGNPNPGIIADAINGGATIINYVGHGSDNSWSTSGFSNSNVNSLTNTDKLPFIISVACVNGNFVGQDCFAEAWLRAEDNGKPSGAVATIMSTINQSWDPPMHGQDEMNDILGETYDDNIKRTFGGITMNGCMAMNDQYGSGGNTMTDTWTIFGDPSLMIRTATPQLMTVDHMATVFIGATSLSVSANAEGGIATLSMNGEIIGSAIVEGGSAVINFDALSDVGIMDLVVTGFNYIPYESIVEIVPAAGAYIVYAENIVNDASGNNDGLVDYNESILLSVSLSNIGTDEATGVNATISTENEFITITDNTESYGTIGAESTVNMEDAFAFDVANNIPDGSLIKINVSAVDGSGKEVWESSFSLIAHAAELNFNTFTIDDATGNGNGKIDPGENVDITVNFSNTGTSEAYNVLANLVSSSSYITVNTNEVVVGNLSPAANADAIFNITADAEVPDGTAVEFNLNMTADYDISATANFSAFVGQKPVLVIDFSAQAASASSMMECFTVLNVGADKVEGSFPDDISIYKSVFVILGVYPNNHALSTAEASKLNTFLENGGRAYMEGGDAWAYDTQTAAHLKFMINGASDGAGDLGRLTGKEGSMLQGYAFNYGGENSYIDKLEPKTGANIILENDSPVYGAAIAYENEVYKTIGASACFGGLTDEDGSTKDEVMAAFLYFFDVNYFWTGIDDKFENSIAVNAFPNPFNKDVNISIDLSETQNVEINVFDLSGRMITSLVNNELQKGNHVYTWESMDSPAGIYFYSVKTANKTYTKKLILNK